MPTAPSLAARALGAVLLMIGFYVLALLIAGGLFAIPLAELRYAHRVDLRPTIFCIVAGFAILRAIAPRIDRFEPPGPPLRSDQQPRLFATITDVARLTDQAEPSEVYLVADVNAWVAQRGGIMGLGSKRVMGLGLPLLQTVSVDELRAILAHEFGHYHGGDTALGPWIYKTRGAIGRTLASLSRHSSILMKPFEWYGLGFLRITHAISRRQEYAADALAARTIGVSPMVSGLRAIHGNGALFGQYWAQEVGPVVARGYRTPIANGFTQFLSATHIAPLVSAVIEREMATPSVDPYDTHPPLRDRIDALTASGLPTNDVPAENAIRAIELLDDVDELEGRLLTYLYKRGREQPLTTIAWPQVGAEVWGAIWRDDVKRSGGRLDGVTVAQIPGLAIDLDAAAVQLGFAPHREAADHAARERVVMTLGTALAVLLLNHGWAVTALPGEIAVFAKDSAALTPFADIARLNEKSLDPASFTATWKALGLLDVDLGTLRGNTSATQYLSPG